MGVTNGQGGSGDNQGSGHSQSFHDILASLDGDSGDENVARPTGLAENDDNDSIDWNNLSFLGSRSQGSSGGDISEDDLSSDSSVSGSGSQGSSGGDESLSDSSSDDGDDEFLNDDFLVDISSPSSRSNSSSSQSSSKSSNGSELYVDTV